ncbi:MAG: hypothetical protein H0V17_24140 [Deltaproteobacteria bacterium]|nr:hypothetical protein [Deltaproteobacteria bacterium]
MTKPRDSARSISLVEEEFFQNGNRPDPTEPIETFSDLDEGYQRQSLWQRLLGKKQR